MQHCVIDYVRTRLTLSPLIVKFLWVLLRDLSAWQLNYLFSLSIAEFEFIFAFCFFQTFRRLLLTKCQDEFENRSKAGDVLDKKVDPLTKEEEEQYGIIKRKMLGNIKFIGG